MEIKFNRKFIEPIFFSNFFMGLLSIVLLIESNILLNLNISNSILYIVLSSLTILFYNFAYKVPKGLSKSDNIRIQHIIDHKIFYNWFNIILLAVAIFGLLVLLIQNISNLSRLNSIHYFIIVSSIFCSINYYSWSFSLNLRKITFIKPTLIANTWAFTTVYLPTIYSILIGNREELFDIKFFYLYTNTFMFFFINAMIFDFKDYKEDYTNGLQTFVVRYGNKQLINCIIFPLLLLGIFSSIFVGIYIDFSILNILILVIPLILFAYLSYKSLRIKPLLYYLVVIDGIIMIKAIFNIIAFKFV